jgi:serine/threonine protein kinase
MSLLCTCRLNESILVIIDEKHFFSLPIQLEGQLSTKIDMHELELGKVIGQGSYGTVYIGRWKGQKVAIKSYSENVISDVSLKGDIEREIGLMSSFRCP